MRNVVSELCFACCFASVSTLGTTQGISDLALGFAASALPCVESLISSSAHCSETLVTPDGALRLASTLLWPEPQRTSSLFSVVSAGGSSVAVISNFAALSRRASGCPSTLSGLRESSDAGIAESLRRLPATHFSCLESCSVLVCTCTSRDALFSRTRCGIWATPLKVDQHRPPWCGKWVTLSRICTTSCLAGCRKTPRWCGLDCTFPACNLQCRTPSCSRRCGSASLPRVINLETLASLCSWISLALWFSPAMPEVNLPSAATMLRAVSKGDFQSVTHIPNMLWKIL